MISFQIVQYLLRLTNLMSVYRIQRSFFRLAITIAMWWCTTGCMCHSYAITIGCTIGCRCHSYAITIGCTIGCMCHSYAVTIAMLWCTIGCMCHSYAIIIAMLWCTIGCRCNSFWWKERRKDLCEVEFLA